MTKKTNQKGFSLIELMIVVAIIGVLATIAIPSFNTFLKKSKASEAKATLSAMFTAQKAYFAEHDYYHPNLTKAGYTPEGQFTYNAGTATDTTSTFPSEVLSGDKVKWSIYATNNSLLNTDTCPADCQTLVASTNDADAVVTAGPTDSFEFVAVADIDGDTSDYDEWTITSARVLEQVNED